MKKGYLDTKSIRFTFWKYFVSFAALILIILWLLQTVFLNQFYETMKIREIDKIGNEIMLDFGKEDFATRILITAFTKGIGIRVIDEDGWKVYPTDASNDIFQQRYRMGRVQFKKYFGDLDENQRSKIFTEKFQGSDNIELIFTGFLPAENGEVYYLWINTPLEPVESTIDILKNQLIIVSVLSLALALFLSYFISNRLARPLVKMSNTAKELGEGNMNVVFDKARYTEVDELAKALNHATEEITKTIEMRKDLIANVSHDLKTPLTVIKSYGEMIRDISGNDEALRNRHIDTIISESDHLTNLVNDLLDLSKVESELEDIKMIPFNLEETVDEVLHRFDILAEKEGYEFKVIVEGNPTILGDESKIKQVLYNFISNGINYSKDEKKVIIRLISDKNQTLCEVEDFGVGIDENYIKHIWDRYYRVRDNHSRLMVGTGLGLYIVKNILELHGFEYGVKSKKGIGTTFYFIAKK
ncbi:MAG: HAMP domain-containing sensor histidine kinase [Tissierellia bacterium]|nr:HAMP domain-containing sensor histidine kinase [Tissierellia bacterium]